MMSVGVRNQFRDLIALATKNVGDQLLGLDLSYYTSATATPVILKMMPQSDNAVINQFLGAQTEITEKIFSVSRQTVLVNNVQSIVPGPVYNFKAGHFIVFEGFQWVVKAVSESTGLGARWDLLTTRSHAVRMT